MRIAVAFLLLAACNAAPLDFNVASTDGAQQVDADAGTDSGADARLPRCGTVGQPCCCLVSAKNCTGCLGADLVCATDGVCR